MKVECPQCSTAYELPDEYIGKKLKCKKCESIFEVENPSADDNDNIEDNSENKDEALFDMDGSAEALPQHDDNSSSDFEISFEDMPSEEEEEEIEGASDEEPENSSTPEAENEPETTSEQEDLDPELKESTSEKIQHTEKTSSSKMPVIILAVLLVVALAGVGIFAFMWQESESNLSPYSEKVNSLNTEIENKNKAEQKYKAEISELKKNNELLSEKIAEFEKETLLFYDGFDTDLVNDRWLIKNGSIETTEKGRMKLTAKENSTGEVFCRTGIKGNIQIEYDCKISALKDDQISDMSFLLSADIEKPFERGYFFGIGSENNKKVKVLKKNETIFLKNGSPVENNGIYHFRIVAENGKITVFLQDIRKGNAEEKIIGLENCKLPPNGCFFGLYTWNSEVLIDKVKIVKLSE